MLLLSKYWQRYHRSASCQAVAGPLPPAQLAVQRDPGVECSPNCDRLVSADILPTAHSGRSSAACSSNRRSSRVGNAHVAHGRRCLPPRERRSLDSVAYKHSVPARPDTRCAPHLPDRLLVEMRLLRHPLELLAPHLRRTAGAPPPRAHRHTTYHRASDEQDAQPRAAGHDLPALRERAQGRFRVADIYNLP